MMKYVKILGVKINNINLENAVDSIIKQSKMNFKGFITVTGVHGIMESQRSIEVKKAHQNAWLSVPDGMPLVYIGKLFGFREISRCYGPDLMSSIMDASRKGEIKHFLYGGKVGVAQLLKNKLEMRFPGVNIIGTYTPPFRHLNEIEYNELKAVLNHCKPDIIWIGLSTPKQEIFMYEYINKLDVKIMVGVGAAFDILTGNISRAPSWMQKIALEWLFRLFQEPKRLWKRYFINNPLFIFYFLLQITGIRKYE